MDAKIIAGILAAGGAALAVGGIYSMNKKTGYFKKGNSVRYDVSRIPFKKTSPLKGKTVVFLGSSVTKGLCCPQQFVCGVHSEERQLYLHQKKRSTEPR